MQDEALKWAKRQVLQESNDSTSVSDANTNEDDEEDDGVDAGNKGKENKIWKGKGQGKKIKSAERQETMRFGTGVPHVGFGVTQTALGGILQKVINVICVKFCLTLITHRVTTIAPISVKLESNACYF